MELYAERLRLAAQAEAEAAGQSFWSDEIPHAAGWKIIHSWRDIPTEPGYGYPELWANVVRQVQQSLGTDQELSVTEAFTQRRGTSTALTYLEAMVGMLTTFMDTPYYPELEKAHVDFFTALVNRIFNSHRVAFKLLLGEVVPLDSEELHVAVIEPVIYLLHGRPDLAKAQTAYMKALKEITSNDPADAITDAGTALQETLEALGCEGNTLGRLISSARKNGLLGSYDKRMTNAIEGALLWAAKERNEGEAHHAVDVPLSDAWLMVHVVGALIVRLSEGSERGEAEV